MRGISQKYAIGIVGRRARLRAPQAAVDTDRPRNLQASAHVKLFDRVLNPREIRRRLGLNQEQFWTQIGVTQSGGSRYESGREMPKPVRELLRLVHVEQIDLSQVKRVDFEIISYLKESHPDLYRSLRRAVRSRHRGEPAADKLAISGPDAELEADLQGSDGHSPGSHIG
jgi:DNA-binding transcriptional regulator YiaG